MRRARARGFPAGRIWSMGPDTCLGTSTRTRTIRPIRRAIRASSNNTALPGPGEEEWTWSVAGGWASLVSSSFVAFIHIIIY